MNCINSTVLSILLAIAGCASIPSGNEHLWKVQSFDFPQDALACDGRQLVQFNQRYLTYVGLTLCNDRDEFRVYMSLDGKEFLPVTDTGGHGQDHCELVNGQFELPDGDDIQSGGCATCSTSMNLPLEHVDTWSRADIGKPFSLVRSGKWAHQTSRLQCGVVFQNCIKRGHLETTCDAVVMEGRNRRESLSNAIHPWTRW